MMLACGTREFCPANIPKGNPTAPQPLDEAQLDTLHCDNGLCTKISPLCDDLGTCGGVINGGGSGNWKVSDCVYIIPFLLRSLVQTLPEDQMEGF